MPDGPRLERFKAAQDSLHAGYESALTEIRAGGKRGHWIWYVFPQLSGLGTSSLSQAYAIGGEDEAIAFVRDPLLRSRLLTITEAVAAQLRRRTPATLGALMGSDVDARKIVSSLTLFRHVARALHTAGGNSEYEALAAAADEVLTAAAAEGYQPCAYTLRHLRGPG
ncbi:MAG TPA: DUF1810 family protein [Vicinamibacterales bacterium]|nr:DUF1810 family protein [Vicinamibacterales bacterium]